MGVIVKNISYYLPQQILTNHDLEVAFSGWSAAKIEKKVGIKSRHIAGADETALDMAEKACKKLFEECDSQLIDYVLFCTQSPDYPLPTTACILQKRLNLRKNIGALDFNLGCSGYIYGLSLAKGLISAGIAKNVLLVTSETYSKYMSKNDRSNRSIFGDAATATLLSFSENDGIGNFYLGTDGSGADNLIVKNGGARNHYNPDAESYEYQSSSFITDNNLYMNGPEIFNFTLEAVPQMVEEALKANNTDLSHIDYIVFHQANKYMLKSLMTIMQLPAEKFYINLEETGNTVSSSIPLALKQAMENGFIRNGDRVLVAGFGVGYSYGATIVSI